MNISWGDQLPVDTVKWDALPVVEARRVVPDWALQTGFGCEVSLQTSVRIAVFGQVVEYCPLWAHALVRGIVICTLTESIDCQFVSGNALPANNSSRIILTEHDIAATSNQLQLEDDSSHKVSVGVLLNGSALFACCVIGILPNLAVSCDTGAVDKLEPRITAITSPYVSGKYLTISWPA